MPILLLIVFVDLLGFGILVPLFPYVAEQLGATPFWVTFGGAGVYSLFQLASAPVWGRLSDAWGRKPILVASMFGASLAYLAMAFVDSLWLLIATRAFQGVMAGNIAAAFAYATDVSRPEDRTRALGLVGAAFGLGFTLGPALGGLLGGTDPTAIQFAPPALIAAALSFVAFLGALAFLRESLDVEHRRPLRGGGAAADAAGTAATAAPAGDIAAVAAMAGAVPVATAAAAPGAAGARATAAPTGSPSALLAARPALALLIAGVLVVQIAATLMQSIYPLWAHRVYGHGPLQVGYVFFALGILAVICQAGLAGPLARRVTPHRVAAAGVVLYGAGLALLAAVQTDVALWLGIALLGLGLGVYSPAVSALVSLQSGPRERGSVMGLYNAASSAGRIVGPMISGPLYAGHTHWPFLLGALLVVPALLLLRRPGTAAVPAVANR